MRNWYVITGGPSAGKTTLIKALEVQGFRVEHESARAIIDEGLAKGMTLEEIRSDQQKFQEQVFEHRRSREAHLDPGELIFFDRGMHDTYAYQKLHGFVVYPHMQSEIEKAEYKKVFLLESFQYEDDYARTESPEVQKQLFDFLREAYERTNIPVVTIPIFPTVEERTNYFFKYLIEHENIDVIMPNKGKIYYS